MSEDRSPFVAREQDIAALQSVWEQANAGAPQTLRLQAPFGGGRRALTGEFLRTLQKTHDDLVVWRVSCLDQENGVQWLVRMYGSLMATLTSDVLRRGKIEMVLNAQVPNQPKRVQGWYQQFIAAMKESRTDKEKGQVQLRIPQDNPLLGLVEVTHAIARKVPVVLELQHPYAVNSLTLSMFVEALHAEARETGARLMLLLWDEPENETNKALFPLPLLDFYTRREDQIATHVLAPWGADEAATYLASRDLSGNAARLAEIAGGRPGFIAELTDILVEEGLLDGDLEGVTLGSLVPLEVDVDELEVPDAPSDENEPKHASADDIGRVAHLAALLGQAFPSNLIADMGGLDRESVDDLIDATSDLFEEVEFNKSMNTWLYRFKRGGWREGILERNDNDEAHEVARRVGVFMERFLVPRNYGFIVKTARVYAENGAPERAAMMRALALSNDNGDVWGLCYDFSRYFDELVWPDPLKRTIQMNLLERLVTSGPVQAAERVHGEAVAWAAEQDDRDMTAWLLYMGSRLDTRRQDHYRARDRANDALKLYEALENSLKVAELHNHIAMIELQDGNTEAALERTNQAIEAGQVEGNDGKKLAVPGVLAMAEHIRGGVARRAGELPKAVEHFRNANNVAGQSGLAQLALDSGLSFGEALLASGQVDQAREALQRVQEIAQALRNAARERNACELLAQCWASQKQFDKALPLAERTLELTRALNFDNALPIDLYNLGFFHYATQRPTEALTYFREASSLAGNLGNHPVIKELRYFMGLAHLQAGEADEAKASLQNGIPLFKEANDLRKMCGALDALAQIEARQGNTEVARKLLSEAIDFAKQGGMREERKALRKRLESL